MLDGLLGSGFKAKCKSVIKSTRTRIEVVRRRAEAKQRFLKEDLAKLLANGLDINAFGRTEEFLAGLNLLASYDFLEQTCQYITEQLSCMQKQRECPEECREAVGSLMFAAARFSDLPELRDLRDLFQERYGNSLECFVNQKFLEKLSSRPPERERRVQLLQDIASEFSIKWNSRGFEQRMNAPHAPVESRANKNGSSHITANNYPQMTRKDNAEKIDKREFPAKLKPEVASDGDRLRNGREDDIPKRDRQDAFKQRPELVNGGDETRNAREGSIFRRKESDNHLQSIGRREGSIDSRNQINDREGTAPEGLNNGNLFHERRQVKEDKYRSNSEKDDSNLKAARSSSSSHRKRSENDNIGYIMHNNVSNEISNDREGTAPEGLHNGNLFHERRKVKEDKYRSNNEKDDSYPKAARSSSSSHRKRSENDNIGYIMHNNVSNDREGTAPEGLNNGNLFHERRQVKEDKYRSNNEKDDSYLKAARSGSSSHRKRSENANIGYIMHNNVSNEISKGESCDNLSRGESEVAQFWGKIPEKRQAVSTPLNHIGQSDVERSNWKAQQEEAGRLHSYKNSVPPPPYVKSKDSLIPPPYTKPRDDKHGSSRRSKHAYSEYDGPSVESSVGNKVNAVDHSERIRREVDQSKPDRQSSELTPVEIHGPEELVYNKNGMIPLPKPRSIRRKHQKSSSHQNDVASSEDAGGNRRSSSSRRREHANKGLQILFDDEHHQKDAEEKVIDKLLIHYSKKPANYDIGKLRKKSHRTADVGEPSHDRNRDGLDGESEHIALPTRSVSLPHETAPQEEIRIFPRANSFQPDNQGGHVHPKLPDYDDLAARFAALRGR